MHLIVLALMKSKTAIYENAANLYVGVVASYEVHYGSLSALLLHGGGSQSSLVSRDYVLARNNAYVARAQAG